MEKITNKYYIFYRIKYIVNLCTKISPEQIKIKHDIET